MNFSFDIAGAAAVTNERLAIVLGFITLFLSLLTFFSCRTFINLLGRLGLKNASQNQFYQGFNKFHSYYWWAFGVAVLTHLVIATLHTGLPQAGDPDANVHWAILGLGLAGALTGIALFLSCRVLPRLMSSATDKFSLTNGVYKSFFKYHTYYWWVFVVFVAAHFAVSFIHAGAWPR